jgi:hypothetical protein
MEGNQNGRTGEEFIHVSHGEWQPVDPVSLFFGYVIEFSVINLIFQEVC